MKLVANRSDNELLERETKAAGAAALSFREETQKPQKRTNLFFGIKSPTVSVEAALENGQEVYSAYEALLFEMDTPTSFSAVENDSAYLAERQVIRLLRLHVP
ncbi:MAG TPA: hypothetical protein VJ723_11995 [Candidatus Angelobacter sp.]|nr:hypothetical protein [Candidatus Angelobacter sp.]